jgi:protein-S-isoprenylcysteine O-methyltransferase Ste14
LKAGFVHSAWRIGEFMDANLTNRPENGHRWWKQIKKRTPQPVEKARECDMGDSFIQRGGRWVLAQGALLLAVAILGLTSPQESKHLAWFVGGLFFLLVSGGCGLAGVIALGQNLTPYPKPSAKAQLVQRGIYGLVRHPLYTAVLCGAIGWSLFRQSLPALATALVLAVFFDARARREERWLRNPFPEYASYQQRVRRFLPWIY